MHSSVTPLQARFPVHEFPSIPQLSVGTVGFAVARAVGFWVDKSTGDMVGVLVTLAIGVVVGVEEGVGVLNKTPAVGEKD